MHRHNKTTDATGSRISPDAHRRLGLSFFREKMFEHAEQLLADGVCDLAGFGRMWLAYPEFYRDWRAGKLEPKKCCLTCSRCTELMRGGRESGCAIFNDYYRNSYREMRS